MSDHQFKPGDKVLVEGTFEMDSRTAPDCAWVQFPCACASPEPQETHCITLSAIRPAPREGEYRMTRDELKEMVNDFFKDFYSFRIRDNDEWVDEWLVNRKETK